MATNVMFAVGVGVGEDISWIRIGCPFCVFIVSFYTCLNCLSTRFRRPSFAKFQHHGEMSRLAYRADGGLHSLIR